MKFRNKKTGEIIDLPDNDPVARQVMERHAKPAQAANGGEGLPFLPAAAAGAGRFFKGAGRTVMETGGEAPLRFLAARGVPFAKKAVEGYEDYKKSTPLGESGETGATVADAGMLMLPTPGSKIKAASFLGKAGKVLIPGIQGAAQHQAQNYAREGKADTEGAAWEVGATAAAGAVPGFLRKLGVSTLRRSLGIPKKFFAGANKIDLIDALEKRKIPFFGGAEKIGEKAGGRIGKANARRGDLLEQEGVEMFYPDAVSKAKTRMTDLEKAGKIDAGSVAQMGDAISQAERNAAIQVNPANPAALKVPGKNAIDLRKRADEGAHYDRIANKVPPPGPRFNQAYRDEIELDLARGMNKTPSAQEYSGIRRELRKDTPLKQAADDKAARSIGMMDLIGAGVLGAPGAYQLAQGDVEGAIKLGGAGLLAHGAFRTPGGARTLYEVGRGPRSKVGRKGTEYMIDLARSGLFRPEDDQ